tara:strand:+ start:183 stop:926 length:744 start_codon:yes stop_codon:yes gene_type:complete
MNSNILLTGGTGKLGNSIINSNLFNNLDAPKRSELDITSYNLVNKYFDDNKIDTVIHCAALARLSICHNKPDLAIKTNIIGTEYLVKKIKEIEYIRGDKIRFIYISTDGVYKSKRGNYSEEDKTEPNTIYGWTKLAAEYIVKRLSNHVIIRTRFFDPDNIPFTKSAEDIFSSNIPLVKLIEAIKFITENQFSGVINIGEKRLSDYERYKLYKPNIKPCSREELANTVPFELAYDASMDCSLWNDIST